jgi:hypothetical protein
LIVAVERNSAQIDHLTAVASRVKAELRLADSIGSALRLIEAELPDVILIPALLSSKDELALGSRLRDLGSAAAHVQTLTMPRFEPPTAPSGGGMLSFKRKALGTLFPRTAADTFVAQLTVYLERATAIRPSPRRRPDPPPLELTKTDVPSVVSDGWNVFDPSEPRFVALIAQLDELSGLASRN